MKQSVAEKKAAFLEHAKKILAEYKKEPNHNRETASRLQAAIENYYSGEQTLYSLLTGK